MPYHIPRMSFHPNLHTHLICEYDVFPILNCLVPMSPCILQTLLLIVIFEKGTTLSNFVSISELSEGYSDCFRRCIKGKGLDNGFWS